MVIIETNLHYKKFKFKFKRKDCIILPIQSDDKKHPQDTTLSLLYFYFIENGDEYIIPFNHSEAINSPEKYLEDISQYSNTKYTIDKKKLLHFSKFEEPLFDVGLNYYLKYNEPLDLEVEYSGAHDFINSKFYHRQNINTVIPILKHLEFCRQIVEKIVKLCVVDEKKSFRNYNREVINNLHKIERNGIYSTDGLLYSEYNLYTSTGRPSNRFGGINFAALNKHDGSRQRFISRFNGDGMLVEYDYDAYHLRLIGDLIGYKFPKKSVHNHMAKLYGNVSYEDSKALSFKYLYGKIPRKILKINPFFRKVQDYIDLLWVKYKKSYFIESDIYNKKIYRKNLYDMNKNKLFNYMIQLRETENNMRMLTELTDFMKDYESKLVLYSYDSFLIDFNINDGLYLLKMIKAIIEQDGKFPVTTSKGPNYHEMEDITERLL